MRFEEVKELPDEPLVVLLEAILMPNGELISNGKSILWEKELKSIFRRVDD